MHNRKIEHTHFTSTISNSAPRVVLTQGTSPFVPSQHIIDTINQHAAQLADSDLCPSTHCTESFFVLDLARVRAKFELWKEHFPNVTPFYAVKSNPHPAIVRCLAELGASFDCASPYEIALVTEQLGVSPDRIIYANPCKSRGSLHAASRAGVRMTTFDSEAELYKIASIDPSMELVLRIYTNDKDAQCSLSNKFGAHPGEWLTLLNTASRLGMNISGISFHVGSGGNDTSYRAALKDASDLVVLARACGHEITLLDIGGGFPGTCAKSANNSRGNTLAGIATIVNEALESFPHNVRVIAEPGRFFCAESQTLTAMVIAKRERQGRPQYYIANSVYSSFNCVMFDHTTMLQPESDDTEPREVSTVFGQTCDGIDEIAPSLLLPNLSVGDWLAFPAMGAYTSAASSTFNGFQLPKTVVINDEEQRAETFVALESQSY